MMRRCLPVVGMLLYVLLAIALFWPLRSAVEAQGPVPEPSVAQQVVFYTNQERAKVGLPPLKQDPLLDQAATMHAKAMAEKDFFAHEDAHTHTTPGDRVSAVGYTWTVVAENLFAGEVSPAEVVQKWMGSPEHRDNILRTTVREIGVGDVLDEADTYPTAETPYRHYWVQVFGVRRNVYPLIIQQEAFSTTTTTVSLYIYGQGWAEQMRLQNDGGSWSEWEPYSPQKVWTLREEEGFRTVTVELRKGSEVRSASDSIYLALGKGAAVPAPVRVPLTPTLSVDSLDIVRTLNPPVPVPGSEARVTLKISGKSLPACTGIPLKAADVLLVYDVSSSAGSGPGSNWEQTVRFTEQLFQWLASPVFKDHLTIAYSRAGIISSQTVVTGAVPLLLQDLTTDYDGLARVLRTVQPAGDTDIAAGVYLAQEVLGKEAKPDSPKAIVLMLHDNVPLTPAALDALRKAQAQGIDTYVVVNSLNISPENRILPALLGEAVPSKNLFIDPGAKDLQRLFIAVAAGDVAAAARNVRIIEEWAPAEMVELSNVTGPGGRVEGNQILWDIPRIAKGETIELSYQLRLSKAISETAEISSHWAYIDCSGQLRSNIVGEKALTAPEPTPTRVKVAVATLAPAATATPTATPTYVPLTSIPPMPITQVQALTVTLCPGDTYPEQLQVFIPPAPRKADVLFLFDVTSSMAGVLNAAAQNADLILQDLARLIPDVQWAVVSVSDYPVAPYGRSSDHPCLLHQAVTADANLVRQVLQALPGTLEDGGDAPEAYGRALSEIASDPRIGWRTGARHIIIFFGDSVPHDEDIGTGIDPGRDEQFGTADDLDFEAVLKELAVQEITLLYVLSGNYEWLPNWQAWTAQAGAGSQAVTLQEASQVPGIVMTLISQVGQGIGLLRLEPDPAYSAWVSTQPSYYTNLTIPGAGLAQPFTVHFKVPSGTPADVYRFSLRAIGDGGLYGIWDVQVTVPVSCAPTPIARIVPLQSPCETFPGKLLKYLLPLLLVVLVLLLWWWLMRRLRGPGWRARKSRQGLRCLLPCLLALLYTLFLVWLLGGRLAEIACRVWTSRAIAAAPAVAGATPVPGSPAVGAVGSQKVAAIISGGLFVLRSERPGVTFTQIRPNAVNPDTLAQYDTLVLSQVCDIGRWPKSQLLAINQWLANGGKLIIYDSDECGSPVDYFWLPYPFTTDNPGAWGSTSGHLEIVADDTMIALNPSISGYIPIADFAGIEIGDANVMVTRDVRWCGDMEAVNLHGQKGFVHAYAFYGRGLIIYNGLDTDDIASPGMYKLWQNELAQPWGFGVGKAVGLPCQRRVAVFNFFAPWTIGGIVIPFWLPLVLLPILWFLCWLFCRIRRRVRPLPSLGSPPEYRKPLEFLTRWTGIPPEWDPAPTLVIGLGGAGRAVLTHLKKNLWDADPWHTHKQVQLLLLDVAPSEIVAGREVPVQFVDVQLSDEEQLVLGTDLRDLITRLAQDRTYRPEMQPWFPADDYVHVRRLPDADMDASRSTRGRRPLGRAVLFEDACHEEASRLWQKLLGAIRNVAEGNRARIIIVGSLCGGFGSAVLADVAYLVRRVAEAVGIGTGVLISAFLATDNAFAAHTRAPHLQVNSMATLRELGRFLLARGRPFPMVYNAQSKHPAFHGYMSWSVFDEVFLFDGQRPEKPLTLIEPERGMFPLMADLITEFIDRRGQIMEQVRANLRVEAANVQVRRGEPVISTLGAYTYRLPLRDIVRALKVRFVHDLLLLFLLGPEYQGRRVEKVEITPELSKDRYPEGLPALVDHFLRGKVAERMEGAGGPSVFIADLAQRGGVNEGWQSLATEAQADVHGEEGYLQRQVQHFQQVLTAMLLRLLNGDPKDNVIVARCGKLGYAREFLAQLEMALRDAYEWAQHLESQVPEELQDGYSILLQLIHQEHECVLRMCKNLEGQFQFLAGEPGERPAMSSVLTLVLDRLDQEKRWLEAMKNIPVRYTLADETLLNHLYEAYFAPHLQGDALERIHWRESSDGGIELAVRSWQDQPIIPGKEGQQAFVEILLDLAENLGQKIWQLRLDPFFDDEQQGLWNEQKVRQQAENALGWAQPVTTTQVGKAVEQQPHRYLWVNYTVQRRAMFAKEVQLQANMREEVQLINASDPRSAMLITSLDILPISALDCWTRLEDMYRRTYRLSDTVETSRAYLPEQSHVFAAEQHALKYEQRLPELYEAPRLFHPLFTAALEDLERARTFVLAYALGWVERKIFTEAGENKQRYVLTLPGQAEDIPLTREDSQTDPVALLVRAMQNFVLGSPEALQHRYTPEELARLLREAVQQAVPQNIERLRAFLREKPWDLAADNRLGSIDFWSFARLAVRDALDALHTTTSSGATGPAQ